MANPDVLPLNLYIYQGKGNSIDSALHRTPEKIDLAGCVLLKLADTLPQKTVILLLFLFRTI